MNKGKYKIVISAPPHREHPVAECHYDKMQFAEILDEKDEVQIQLYWYEEVPMWEFSFTDVMEVFDKAKRKLMCEE